MLIRFRDERGIAMVVAMMVAFVVLLLGTVVVAQAIHNSDQSGYDRERLQSVNAAEAGLNYFYNHLAKSSPESLATSPITLAVGDAPGTASVTLTPTYYSDANGTVPVAGPFSSSAYPGSVKVKAVGTANGTTPRTMQSFMVLHPVFGGFTGAIVCNSCGSFTNTFTVNGNNGNDGDIYVLTGDFSATSGFETIKGNIYVTSGAAYVGTSTHIYGTVWSNGVLTVDHPNVQIDGDVKSTTSSVAVTAGAVSPGGASYCTTLSGSANIAGAEVQTCSLGAPPTQSFPQIKYNQTDWQNDTPAYTNFVTFSDPATACTGARNYIEGTGAGTYNGGSVGNTVVRITVSCTYSNSNNATITLGSNLALITDGAINLANRSTWNGSSSTRDLFFISPYPSSGAPNCSGGVKDITLGNLTGFNNLVQVSVYSPCTVTMNNNNSAFNGQVIGGTVDVGNNFNMAYRPIKVPGAHVVSFTQDIAYIREVQ
jgi:Tfp pilus assembly protein PilX